MSKSNNTSNKIHRLWPTPVGEFFNPDHQRIRDKLIDFFEDYKTQNPKSKKGIENINLYESGYNIHQLQNESYTKLIHFIAGCFYTMSKKMNDRIIIDDSKYITEIVNSWFIVYENSGFVAPHLHGNCSWSCVYYVQLGDSTGIGNGSTYLLKIHLIG